MKTIKQCPICEKTDFKEHINSIDYSVSKEEFTIIKCTSCDFHFTNPRPTDSELGKYYISDHYISHNNTSKNLFEKTYQFIRTSTFQGFGDGNFEMFGIL